MQKKSEAFPKKIYLKPALEERLAQILAVPLTVAAAPFGYGKTTAVKKVLLSLSVDMLWDTCYTGAEAAFWRCFVKSLQTAGVNTASLTWQELPRNAATRQRVIEVLQASNLKKTVVFVWNNYHLLGSEDCDKLLLALAKADLPNWHFVLLTQRPPDFTLDELENVLEDTQFFRVNRQFIISSDYIKNIHTSPNYKVDLEFQPDEEITVSRERVKDFKDWLIK